MQPIQKLVRRALLVGLLLVSPLVAADTDLYGPNGVRPEGVRQGKLGSCYFHAVIAAQAQANPDSFKRMIQANADGTYTVKFADGVKENAYPDDIRYSRDTGYDMSDGLGGAVQHDPHLRAFYQHLLERGKLKMQALVAVLRKLLHAFHAMFTTRQPFDRSKLFRLLVSPFQEVARAQVAS